MIDYFIIIGAKLETENLAKVQLIVQAQREQINRIAAQIQAAQAQAQTLAPQAQAAQAQAQVFKKIYDNLGVLYGCSNQIANVLKKKKFPSYDSYSMDAHVEENLINNKSGIKPSIDKLGEYAIIFQHLLIK